MERGRVEWSGGVEWRGGGLNGGGWLNRVGGLNGVVGVWNGWGKYGWRGGVQSGKIR